MKPGRSLLSLSSSGPTTQEGVAATGGLGAALSHLVGRRLAAALGDAPVSLVLPHGEEVRASDRAPVARVVFRDPGALFGLIGPWRELHFGEAYGAGRIEIEGDFLAFLEATYLAPGLSGPFDRLAARWRGIMRRRNTLRGARENVHHHYDLGNDFYTLWLDREMVYTCAYFPSAEATLEEAQLAKMEHVCRKLGLRPGETVVEAGCGWGSLALYMARRHGVRVRAFNISHEQVAWARERAEREGLAGQVEFVEDDYRNVAGRYDAFASVGMLEHVGPEHYRDLSRVIDRTLAADGRGLLHFIGRNRPVEFSPFVQRHIFPGAYAPTLREAADVLEPARLSVLDVENLRLHYARTLEDWLARFESHRDEIARRFDDRFVRIWRLYLAGSVAGFRTGALQLFQVLFARERSNAIPRTRSHLYTDAEREAGWSAATS